MVIVADAVALYLFRLGVEAVQVVTAQEPNAPVTALGVLAHDVVQTLVTRTDILTVQLCAVVVHDALLTADEHRIAYGQQTAHLAYPVGQHLLEATGSVLLAVETVLRGGIDAVAAGFAQVVDSQLHTFCIQDAEVEQMFAVVDAHAIAGGYPCAAAMVGHHTAHRLAGQSVVQRQTDHAFLCDGGNGRAPCHQQHNYCLYES